MSARTEPAVKKPEMSSLSAFSRRHLGPTRDEAADMARSLGCASVDDLISKVVPDGIRLQKPLELPEALTEEQALQKLKLFQHLDYVSTVSGGGYIGGWLQAAIANGRPRAIELQGEEPRARALDDKSRALGSDFVR